MPMSTTERARIAGRARQAKLTPDQRREHGRRSYLAGAVTTVVDRAPELTPDQLTKLRALFGGDAG